MKMTKTIALIILVVALAAVSVTFAALEAKRPPNWQLELDKYLAFTAVPSETVTVQSVVQARQPWNFNTDMASAVLLAGWEWGNITIPPPREVKCVLLERVRYSTADAEETRTQEVVLVGYHTDSLWHEGWIVHELTGGPSSRKSQENLAALGCDLGLEL
jgi:hypothetical protein